MKGIILAAGKGTRMYPMTKIISKHLLNIYDKPLIYYPLSVLLLAGIRDILIITNEEDLSSYQKLLGDGSNININITYKIQKEPNGIGEAFILGEEFIGKDRVCLILGDNIFYGGSFPQLLEEAQDFKRGAKIFAYPIANPKNFGVVEFDKEGKVVSIEEKPDNPKSNYAIPGLYFYDNSVIEIAKNIKKSLRGEYEITDINIEYMKKGMLDVIPLSRGLAWLDTGTPENILKASEFVYTMQERQGLYISCIEEIAWRKGFINDEQLRKLGKELNMTQYGKYILDLVGE